MHRKVHLKIGKNFIVQKTEQVARRDFGVCLTGDVEEPSGYHPIPWALELRREVGSNDPLLSL